VDDEPGTLKLSRDPQDALVESPPCVEKDAPHITTNGASSKFKLQSSK
jgi:hypothetical protein